MVTNNFVHWSDGLEGRAFDHHSRNGGGHFPTKTEQIFQMPGVVPGGTLTAGIDSYIMPYKAKQKNICVSGYRPPLSLGYRP